MLDFLKSIGEAITAIFDGLKFVFSLVPKFWLTLGASLDRLALLMAGMPPFLEMVFTITLVIAVIFLILKIFHG